MNLDGPQMHVGSTADGRVVGADTRIDYRTGSPVPRKRAWEIVNDVEGEQVLIDELNSAARKSR